MKTAAAVFFTPFAAIARFHAGGQRTASINGAHQIIQRYGAGWLIKAAAAFAAAGDTHQAGAFQLFDDFVGKGLWYLFLVRKLAVSGACGVKNAGSRIGDVCDYGGKL